jgi:hypothetical protein
MTRTTNARLAGFTFLFYIAAGVAGMVLFRGAAGAEGTAAKVARVVLSLFMCFSALVLAVTLYGITREEDPDLAMLAMICRVGEGVFGAIAIVLGTAAKASASDAEAAHALGALVSRVQGANTIISATFFAVGSTLFCWLLLRGRMIPVPLAWLGVVASVLLVVGLPLQLAGFLQGPGTMLMWIPMAAFEVPLGLWLLIKGVAIPGTPRPLRDAT